MKNLISFLSLLIVWLVCPEVKSYRRHTLTRTFFEYIP